MDKVYGLSSFQELRVAIPPENSLFEQKWKFFLSEWIVSSNAFDHLEETNFVSRRTCFVFDTHSRSVAFTVVGPHETASNAKSPDVIARSLRQLHENSPAQRMLQMVQSMSAVGIGPSKEISLFVPLTVRRQKNAKRRVTRVTISGKVKTSGKTGD